MSFCPNCGNQVDEGMKFCKNCGKPLTESQADDRPEANNAQAAEYQMPPNTGQQYQQPYNPYMPQKSILQQLYGRVKVNAIILLVAACFQYLAGIAYMIIDFIEGYDGIVAGIGVLTIIVAVINTLLSIRGFRYIRDVMYRPVGIYAKFSPLAGSIIILICNVLFGGIIAIAGSICALTVRNFVVNNEWQFARLELQFKGQIQPTTPPQQIYPWVQINVDPELKGKWEEQKAHDKKSRLEKRKKTEWLIAGIVQISIGIIYMLKILYIQCNWSFMHIAFMDFNIVTTKNIYWLIAYAAFFITMFLMGITSIIFFIKGKQRYIMLRSLKVPVSIIQSIIQVILIFENLYFLSMISEILNLRNGIGRIVACTIIVIGTLIAAFPAIFDFVNTSIIKKQENVSEQAADTQPAKKNMFMYFLAAACCLVVTSLVFIGIHCIKDMQYKAEQQRVIDLVKNGYLMGSTDMPIEDALETKLDKLDRSTYRSHDHIKDSNWYYDPYNPQKSIYRDHNIKKINKELSSDDVLISTWFGYEPKEDEYLRTYITFKFNEQKNEIIVYAISIERGKSSYSLSDDEIEEWVDIFF